MTLAQLDELIEAWSDGRPCAPPGPIEITETQFDQLVAGINAEAARSVTR